MNTNAKKWVEALRNGEYKQGKDFLHKEDKYCCLGVACELAIEAGIVLEVMLTPSGAIRYNRFTQILPVTVKDWLGLNNPTGGYISKKDVIDTRTDLARDNDSGKTFSEIADIIESEPEGLFTQVCPP